MAVYSDRLSDGHYLIRRGREEPFPYIRVMLSELRPTVLFLDSFPDATKAFYTNWTDPLTVQLAIAVGKGDADPTILLDRIMEADVTEADTWGESWEHSIRNYRILQEVAATIAGVTL